MLKAGDWVTFEAPQTKRVTYARVVQVGPGPWVRIRANGGTVVGRVYADSLTKAEQFD